MTLHVIENDAVYRNVMPYCEPQLGKRGLYHAIGGDKHAASANMAMLWVLNLSDGAHSLLDIAERACLPFAIVHRVASMLREKGLLTSEPPAQSS
jgi:aminopeptidase-like protein